mgnify:CR=1 FL=1
MFTGLIAEMGRVDALRREGSSYRLTIEAKKIPLTLFVGESVCCNGACLTVTHFDAHCFTVDVMPETVRHTTIGLLKKGDPINLEQTLKLGCLLYTSPSPRDA